MGCPSMNLGISGHARGLQEAKGNKLLPEWYRTGNFFGGKNIKRSKKIRSKRKRRRSYKKVSGGSILSGTAYEKKYHGGKRKYRTKKQQKGGM